jgi:hypothetical protein
MSTLARPLEEHVRAALARTGAQIAAALQRS